MATATAEPQVGDLYEFCKYTFANGSSTCVVEEKEIVEVQHYMDNSVVVFAADGSTATLVYPHGDLCF